MASQSFRMFAIKFTLPFAVFCTVALQIFHIDAQINQDYCTGWNYSDSSSWPRSWPQCGGHRQSPVDVELNETRLISAPIPNLKFRGYGATPTNMTMRNTGVDVVIRAYYADGETPYLEGGMLPDQYDFLRLDFHWGPNNDGGSEHTVGGHSYPLEMHMVHIKRGYPNESIASQHADGYVAVSRLFKLTSTKNRAYAHFGHYLTEVREPGSEIAIKPFPLTKFDFYENDDYWTYPGSLTEPNCLEVVTWIIPTTPSYVAEAQLAEFRSVKLSCDNHNNRPTQPLDGRVVSFVPWDPNQ